MPILDTLRDIFIYNAPTPKVATEFLKEDLKIEVEVIGIKNVFDMVFGWRVQENN